MRGVSEDEPDVPALSRRRGRTLPRRSGEPTVDRAGAGGASVFVSADAAQRSGPVPRQPEPSAQSTRFARLDESDEWAARGRLSVTRKGLERHSGHGDGRRRCRTALQAAVTPHERQTGRTEERSRGAFSGDMMGGTHVSGVEAAARQRVERGAPSRSSTRCRRAISHRCASRLQILRKTELPPC